MDRAGDRTDSLPRAVSMDCDKFSRGKAQVVTRPRNRGTLLRRHQETIPCGNHLSPETCISVVRPGVWAGEGLIPAGEEGCRVPGRKNSTCKGQEWDLRQGQAVKEEGQFKGALRSRWPLQGTRFHHAGPSKEPWASILVWLSPGSSPQASGLHGQDVNNRMNRGDRRGWAWDLGTFCTICLETQNCSEK